MPRRFVFFFSFSEDWSVLGACFRGVCVLGFGGGGCGIPDKLYDWWKFVTLTGLIYLSTLGPDKALDAALSFFKALKVYPQPKDLISIYDKTVPKVYIFTTDDLVGRLTNQRFVIARPRHSRRNDRP